MIGAMKGERAKGRMRKQKRKLEGDEEKEDRETERNRDREIEEVIVSPRKEGEGERSSECDRMTSPTGLKDGIGERERREREMSGEQMYAGPHLPPKISQSKTFSTSPLSSSSSSPLPVSSSSSLSPSPLSSSLLSSQNSTANVSGYFSVI